MALPKHLTITQSSFLDWYFESGQDQENLEIKETLADRLILALKTKMHFYINVQDIFDEANLDAVRLYFTEEYKGETDEFDQEISDVFSNYTLTLID